MSATHTPVSKNQSVITGGQLATSPLTSALKNQSVTSSQDGQPIASPSTVGGLDLNSTMSPPPPRKVKITAGLYGLVHPSYLSGKRETSLTKVGRQG